MAVRMSEVGLAVTLAICGIVAFHNAQWIEQDIVAALSYVLFAKIVWSLLLRKPMWIWWELASPGDDKYIVGYVFGGAGVIFMTYKTITGLITLIGL